MWVFGKNCVILFESSRFIDTIITTHEKYASLFVDMS